MDIKQEILKDIQNSKNDTIREMFTISKRTEDLIYDVSEELDIKFDEAMELLINLGSINYCQKQE